MATSRTGTAQWKRLRKKAIKQAQNTGHTQCPYCGVTLNYTQGRLPNSAEADHITPWSKTKTNTGDLQIICRRCNQSKGNRQAPKTIKPAHQYTKIKTSRSW